MTNRVSGHMAWSLVALLLLTIRAMAQFETATVLGTVHDQAGAVIADAPVTLRERASTILERVGLGDKVARLPSQLSGGEQGRVAIARALVNEPPLILADEPTGTLDTRTGAEIMRMFLDLNAKGQTILMVTHNPENAALSNRILEIRDGRIADPEQVGSCRTSGPERSASW